MRSRELVLVMCLTGSLLGCSSKPSEGDVAAASATFWSGCAKISEVKKTNGIESGNAYRVSFTYNLEVLDDGGKSCSIEFENGRIAGGQMATLIEIHNPFLSSPLKKGDVFSVTSERNMVKSEKGWIFQ